MYAEEQRRYWLVASRIQEDLMRHFSDILLSQDWQNPHIVKWHCRTPDVPLHSYRTEQEARLAVG